MPCQDPCGLGTEPLEETFLPVFDDAAGNRTRPWRPWGLEEKYAVVGGYAVEWLHGRARFVSLRGAGHLAPLNRRARRLEPAPLCPSPRRRPACSALLLRDALAAPRRPHATATLLKAFTSGSALPPMAPYVPPTKQ